MNKHIIIIILFALVSCTNKTNKTQKKTLQSDIKEKVQIKKQVFKTENAEFASYLDLIPNLELPIEKMCYNEFASKVLDQANPIVIRFRPEGANIFGKFSISENVIAVIYLYPADYVYPIIVTYDSNATRISDFGFFDGYCGRDYDFYSSSYCKINESLKISRIDSTILFDMDKNDKTIGIKDIKVNKAQYYINGNGKINKK